MVERPDGELVVVTGASRSGKTTFVTQLVRDWRRLLLWDPLVEHRRYSCERVRSLAELQARVAAPPRLERLSYTPGLKANLPAEFEIFCELAWSWIRLARSAIVVEELAGVTHPGKAPRAWGGLLRQSLRYGPLIVATTQRPAESDKTAFGNASRIRGFLAVTPRDQATIAGYLQVPVEEVAALQPFAWIQRTREGVVTRGGPRIRAKGTPARPSQPLNDR